MFLFVFYVAVVRETKTHAEKYCKVGHEIEAVYTEDEREREKNGKCAVLGYICVVPARRFFTLNSC